MDGGYYGSAGKRSYLYRDSEGAEQNGRQKKRAYSNSDERGQTTLASDAVTEYRILCSGSKIGSIIGKGGNMIKSLRQETRSKIKIEDPVPGADERVIYISSAKEVKDRDKKEKSEQMLCPAQEALFRVHDRIVELERGASDDDDDDEPPKPVTARLLVPNNQIGCLLGKGGKIIEQMRKEIAAQIRVLPKNQLPPCATPDDEVVQLSGDPTLVRKALYAVSSRLHESPARERRQGASVPQGSYIPSGNSLLSPGSLLPSGGSLLAPSTVGGSYIGGGHAIPPYEGLGTGFGSNWSLGSNYSALSAGGGSLTSQAGGGPGEEFAIQIICPNDKIGSMIGKGGNVIRKMREETHADIKIGDPVPETDERVIHISSSEFLGSQTSPTIDAALQVQKRLTELMADKDTDIKNVSTRLLVPSNQIGSLIGKGGAIINEMRKITKANIKIPPKEELPVCAGENEELVQITGGDLKASEHALIEILTRLRNNLFKGSDAVRGGGGIGMIPATGGMYPLNGGMMWSSDYNSYVSPPGSLPASSGKTQRDSRRRQK
eukprot:c23745_g1_i1 orf=387-2030(+)